MSDALHGIFPPVTTPFDSEGAVLIDRFKANLDRWAAFNLAGYLILGSNGETPFLSEEEQLLLVREARARVPAGKKMIVGVSRESTRLCLQFTRKVADLGADYALVGTPCYYKPNMTQDALFAHFWSVADESPIPILIYNVPQFTGIGVSASLMERLSAHENIAGMKESSANLALQGEIRRRTPQRFKLLVGSASTLLSSLIQGACGGIVAVACVLPGETVDLFEAFLSGEWQRAAKLQGALAPVATAIGSQFGIAGLKVAMDLMGYFGGHVRLPLLDLDRKQVEVLKAVLEASGKLPTLQDGRIEA